MKRINCKRPYKVKVGPNESAYIVSVDPGEQEVEDRVAEVGIRNGWAEAKRGRPPVRETTAVEPSEVETTSRSKRKPRSKKKAGQ